MLRTPVADELWAGEYIVRRYGASATDYERLADEDTRLELIDGVLIVHSPASVRHEEIFAFLLTLLRSYASRKRIGKALGSRTAIVLEDLRRVEPDLLFVSNENLHRLGDVALEGPADLVIEILSPATRDYDLDEKRDVYRSGGVPEYWMIDPRDARLLVDRPAGTRASVLSTGRYDCPSIPGFWLKVDWLWQDPLPDPQECLREILAGS